MLGGGVQGRDDAHLLKHSAVTANLVCVGVNTIVKEKMKYNIVNIYK